VEDDPVATLKFAGKPSQEVSLSKWIRQLHRWVAVAFTLTVIANFVDLARGGGNPPTWITYSPLLPLGVLLLTGLYLFVLPYTARWRSARRTA
jgi:hypothetical protein